MGGEAAMANKFLADDERQVRRILETHLKAAAIKEPDAFFTLFTPDATFIGTDDTEQWTRAELADKLFNSPSGWDMTECLERHIYPAPNMPEVVAFFEVLKHKKLGIVRGSGVVIKHYGAWKILQYVLSFSVPNGIAKQAAFHEVFRLVI
jgi:hypothetical protein